MYQTMARKRGSTGDTGESEGMGGKNLALSLQSEGQRPTLPMGKLFFEKKHQPELETDHGPGNGDGVCYRPRTLPFAGPQSLEIILGAGRSLPS